MVSKLLIAVESSIRNLDFGYHHLIRETWGSTIFAPVRFFFAASSVPRELRRVERDETTIDAPDDNAPSPVKTRAICQWAIGKQIDHIFFGNVSLYVLSDPLRFSGYEGYDYTTSGPTEFGYILSKKAFTILAGAPPIGDLNFWLNRNLGPLFDKKDLTFEKVPEYSVRYEGGDESINPTGLTDWMREMHRLETR